MKLVRTLVAAGVVAGTTVAAAPQASACAGYECYRRCVLGIVQQVSEGDLFITCQL